MSKGNQPGTRNIDLLFKTLQEAYDAATEAEEWFSELWVSEKDGEFRLTDFHPGDDARIHLTLINDKIKMITQQAMRLK